LTEAVSQTSRGAILFDADLFDKPGDELFRVGSWASAVPVRGVLRASGRGNTLIVSDGDREFVWRKYIRGGLLGRIIKNTYVWRGEDETRSFREWRLLHKLVAKGINVPPPAAARYRRTAMFYTADLLTVRVPGICSLAQRLVERGVSADFWPSLGRAICGIHDAGIYHADMNAYNVQLDPKDELWLLDFDRGSLSPSGRWKQETLRRQHRSLQKIRQLSDRVRYSDADWELFLQGYFDASRARF
jgi:3-deoxy-D-manno-octulosonic acid kinase